MLVDNPIINSPFEEPTHYWAYDQRLRAQIDPEAFKRMRGTISFPSSPASTGALP